MKQRIYICLLLGLLVAVTGSHAQTYTPVAVTGFNADGIAESGTNSTLVTSTALDLSNNIMYSAAFGAANSLPAGVVNSGTIVNGTRTYQLQPFTANNLMYLSLNGAQANTLASGTFTLTTPVRFSNISLLLFSTEGNSDIDVILNFTDGTALGAGSYTVLDWFGGTGAVYSGYGRTKRLTSGYVHDGDDSGNPMFYPVDVAFSCAYKLKLLQSITITHIGGTTTASRICVLGLSGSVYTPVTTNATITPASCSNANGSIALTATGGTSPLKYSWNTTPVQTTATAVNLAPATYTCTITGADNCVNTYTGVVAANPAAVLSASASAPAICEGGTTNLSVTATGGTISNIVWMPGTLNGANVTVSPAATTTYTVTAKDNFGCNLTATVPVTVKPVPTSTFTISPTGVCLGTPQTITYTGNAPNTATYNWFGFAGAAVQSGSGQGPYSILFNNAGNYTLQLQVENNGCTSTITTQKDTISAPVTASFTVSDDEVCAGTIITATFTGSAANTATATWGWGGGAIQSGSGFGPYNVQYNRNGIISLTVKNGVCVSVANSKLINVIPVPVAAFTADAVKGCSPFAVTFTNQSQNYSNWKWHFGTGDSSVDANPVYTYNDVGKYTVTLITSSQNKCFDTLVQTDYIEVKSMPEAAFTATPVENVPVELHLASFSFTNMSSYGNTYKWHFGDRDSSALINPQHRYLFPGDYTVILEAINDIGCRDTAMRQFFKVLPDKVLDIPNAFSPNGDGVNDTWEIAGLRGAADCRVEIFNRWGEQLYSSQGYYNPWDGTWKGKPVPVATYYYVIKTATKNYNGWVAVIR